MPFATVDVPGDGSAALAAALRGTVGDLEAVCRVAGEALSADHDLDVQLWLLDLDGEHLEVEARWSPRRRTATDVEPFIDLDPAGVERLLHGGTVCEHGFDLPPRWGLAGAADVLFVPLAIGARRPGVLVVATPFGSAPITPADERAAGALGELLALLVDHARLARGAERSGRRQRLLLSIGRHALAAPGLDDLEHRVADDVRLALDADGTCLFRVLPDGIGVIVAGSGLRSGFGPGHRFPISPRAVAAVASGDNGPWTIDVPTVTYGNSLSTILGFTTACAVVLRPAHGAPLVFGAGRSTPRMFAGPDRRFLESAGDLLTAGIDSRATHAQLRRQATADDLTGLPNRAALYERLGQEIAAADAAGTSMALVLADLDGFKFVNDSMGHTEGDRLLSAVSARLAAVVRPGDLVARLGGDEFALVCADVDERGAVAIAERVLRALAPPVALAHRQVVPHASIGVAVHDPVPATPGTPSTEPRSAAATALVQHADTAMYRAKSAGGNRVTVYDVVLDEQVRRRLAIEQGLRAALTAGRLTLAYQPVVDLTTGRIHGIEALVRWFDDELGHVSPGEFVPVAEQSDLVCRLDAWVLRTATAQLVRWTTAGLTEPDRMGVNLSARNFAEPHLAERVAATLRETGCPPGRVLVEITESLLTDGLGPASVRELLDLGLEVAIDDFGVGFSSLAQLKRVPFSYLKIDRSFISGLLSDPIDGAIVRSTLALARELGKQSIAEGVETVEQLRELERLGCGIVQGYLLGRPADAATMTRWLEHGLDVPIDQLLAARPPTP